MIKGIFLKEPLYMKTVSDTDILLSLDPLKRIESTDPISCSSYSMVRKKYYSKKFFIYTYTFDELDGYRSMWKLLDTLQDAVPNFFKAFRWTKNTIIVAYQRPSMDKDEVIVENLVDELLRVTTWMLKEFRDPEYAAIKIKDYFELCVSYEE